MSDLAVKKLSPEQPAFNEAIYARMLADPKLAELDWLVESDKDGNPIVSAPPSRRHRQRQSRILVLLERLLPEGAILTEYPVSTPEGVKTPDVVWLPPDSSESSQTDSLDEFAPDLCVEVMSPADTSAEIGVNVAVYFGSGAQEVWICDLKGRMAFYAKGKQIQRSRLCPDFPAEILPS